jgi:hypothetical protein
MALKLEPAWTEAELEARLGPETVAWLDHYLDTMDPADMDGLLVVPQPPYTPAQRRLLAARDRWLAEADQADRP